MEKVREKIDKALDKVYNDLANSKPGSSDYDSAVKAVKTISELQIAEYSAESQALTREEEAELERAKFEEEKKKNLDETLRHAQEMLLKKEEAKREKIKIGIGIGSTAATVLTYVWGLRRITKFEDTGVVTSKSFNLLPKLTNVFFKK